jgi:transcriptional regulator with GAF, ATPase, and Fis domain
MEALAGASWPGNVRELQNFIERAVILTQGSELYVPLAELRDRIQAHGGVSMSRSQPASTFHDAERQAIVNALKAASGRIAGTGGAAEHLGLKRTTLQVREARKNQCCSSRDEVDFDIQPYRHRDSILALGSNIYRPLDGCASQASAPWSDSGN